MLLLASNNKGKLAELRALFPAIQVLSPTDRNLDLEVAENSRSFFENAFLKASAFARVSGLVALADDSGLEIDALNGCQYTRARLAARDSEVQA